MASFYGCGRFKYSKSVEYNNFQPRSTEEFLTKEIALASMEGAEKQILKSLDTGNVDDIKIVSQIISIGRFALDFSTDFIPGVAGWKICICGPGKILLQAKVFLV